MYWSVHTTRILVARRVVPEPTIVLNAISQSRCGIHCTLSPFGEFVDGVVDWEAGESLLLFGSWARDVASANVNSAAVNDSLDTQFIRNLLCCADVALKLLMRLEAVNEFGRDVVLRLVVHRLEQVKIVYDNEVRLDDVEDLNSVVLSD